MASASRRFGRVVLASVASLAAAGAQGGPLGWAPPPPHGAPAPGATPASPANPPADVHLVWVDVAGVARAAFPEARREILSMLGRAGLRAGIREGDVRGVSGPSELTVVVLPGPPPAARLHDTVMGATQRTTEGVRAMWVYASAVGATLGLDPRSGGFWSLPERRQFGTALGRVVVHELVHALAPQHPHEAEGLMAERLGRAQLLRPRLAIGVRTAAALHESLSRGVQGGARRSVHVARPR